MKSPLSLHFPGILYVFTQKSTWMMFLSLRKWKEKQTHGVWRKWLCYWGTSICFVYIDQSWLKNVLYLVLLQCLWLECFVFFGQTSILAFVSLPATFLLAMYSFSLSTLESRNRFRTTKSKCISWLWKVAS